jgi:hypothetical protein
MVDQLDQNPIRIAEIKGTGAVAVCFWFLCQRNTQPANPFGPCVDVFRSLHDKTDVMDHLYGPGLAAGGQLVQRKIIVARSEIRVLLVRHPLEFHTEGCRIEGNRRTDIAHVESDVSEA